MNGTNEMSLKTKQMAGGCCICLGEEGLAENPLVICYGLDCTVVVHKVCYGIANIPHGAWFCRKCEFQDSDDIKACKLCPSKDGALKMTEHGGWAHVVCALYIPEIKFENDSTLEPIFLKRVPLERYNKSCCICQSEGQESKAKFGACMNCNSPGCNNHFHVTCGQAAGGLLSEKRGYSDRDTYFGYCPFHHNQLKKEGNLKDASVFKPLSAETEQSNSTLDTSSCSVATTEHQSVDSTSHGSKKKKRKKRGRKPVRSVGICRDWTYSLPPVTPVIVDSAVDTKASQSTISEIDPYTNVLTGVGLVPKQVASKSDIGHVNAIKELIRVADENTEGIPPSGSKQNVAAADDPSEPIASMDECAASWKEPSRSETPKSLCDYDSESTLSNTSDFGDNIKYRLDYIFSQRSTRNSANLLQSEPTQTRSCCSKSSKASDAPSSPDQTREKQPSSKWRKKEASGTTNSSLFVSPPVTPENQLYLPTFLDDPETSGLRGSMPLSLHLLERSLPEASFSESTMLSMSEQFHHQTDSPGSSSTLKQLTNIISETQMLDRQLSPTSDTEQEMSESMSGVLDIYNASALASSPMTTTSSSYPGPTNVSSVVNSTMTAFPTSFAPDPRCLVDHLERLWEQGDQELMEEGQHYDAPSLLACLNTIRKDNTQLQDNVAGLIKRRDRLLAANARSSNPLTVQTVTQSPFMANSDSNRLDDGTSTRDFIRQGNTELEDRIASLTERRNDLLDVHAKLSIPLAVQPVAQVSSMAISRNSPAGTSITSGSFIGNSVHVSLDGLIRNMSMLLSLSSPEIAESADMPTREQQLPVLHHPNLHPVSSPAMLSQHGLTAGRDISEDLPLDLRVNPTERR